MDDVNKNISELDIVNRTNEKSEIQPLTILVLELSKNKEENSNAAGFIDASGKCKKLTNKQIKAGYKSDCDTESKGDAATVAAVEEYLKSHPELANQNEKLKSEVNKAGGWQNFWNNFTTWSKTDQGVDILNTAGGLLGGLLGRQETPQVDVSNKIYGDNNEPKGLNPIWWVAIAVGGIALIGGIAFAIYKFGVKKN